MPLRVDIATGETTMHRNDVRLPGYLPLTLGRTYRSGRDENGPFGPGWRLNVYVSLRVESEQLVYAPRTPFETVFSPVDEGMEARHATGVHVQQYADEYVVVPSPDRRLVFTKENAQDDVLIPLSRIEDGQGNDVHLFFDRDRLVGLVDSVGRQVRFKYRGGTVQRIELKHDDATILRTFDYDARGDLVTETDEDGYSTSFEYHDHLMVATTNRCGGTQYAQYDDDRKCRALWYGDGSHGRRVAYDAARSSARVVGATGQQTLYRYAPTGQVVERIDPTDRSLHYYYDDTEQLVGYSDEYETVQTFQHLEAEEGLFTRIDGEERAAFLEVDENLRLMAVTDAQDRRAGLSYDGHSRPTGLRMETGAEWTLERDARGAVTRVQSPSGREVQFRWETDAQTRTVEDENGRLLEDHVDERGRLVERTDGLGRRFQWRYDATGRLKSVRVGSQSVAFEYDPEGHVTRVREASGRESTFTYDPFGRLQKWDGPDGPFRIEYGDAGRVRAIHDGDGRTVRYDVDGYGRVTQIRQPNGRETVLEAGDDGTLVTVDTEAGTTRTQFNRCGEPVEWTKPNRPTRQFTYGPSGTLRSAERGDDSVVFDYRDDGLLQRVQMPGTVLTLRYDVDGQLDALAVDDRSVVTCDRDVRGHPTDVEAGGRHYQIAFDAGNRLRSIASGDHRWTFGYDALDHLTEVQGPRTGAVSGETVDRVVLSATAEEGTTARIAVHAARGGLALSADVGDACVPLWGRRTYERPLLSMSAGLRAASIVRGADPLREMLTPSSPLDRRGEWENVVRGGLRWEYTEIPSTSETRRPSWTTLDRFYLTRSYYAVGMPGLVPGDAFGERPPPSQTPDAWTSGAHAAGTLRPPVWSTRSPGRHLYHAALGMAPGPKDVFDLLRARTHRTSWR